MKNKIVHACEKFLDYSLLGIPIVLTFSRALTEILLVVTIVSWLAIKFLKKTGLKIKKELIIPIFIYWFVNAISIFSSSFPLRSLEELLNITEYMIIALIVMESFCDAKKIEILSKVIIFTAFAISIDGIFQLIIGHDLLRWKTPLEIDGTPRLTASFNHPNNLGAFLSMTIPIGISLIFFKKGQKYILLLPFILFVIAWTFSRGAWVSLTISMVVFSILKDRRVGWVMIIVFIIFVFAMPDPIIHRLKEVFNIKNVTTQTRFELWESAWQIYIQKPLVGNGLKTFSCLMEKGYVHNCYLQILVETGILGLLSFIYLLITFFSKTLSVAKNTLQIGLGCALLTSAIHSIGDTNLYSIPIATFFWFVLGAGLSFENNQAFEKKDRNVNFFP